LSYDKFIIKLLVANTHAYIVYVKQKEDLVYVAKLVVGSFGGAGVIKYGSAIFPEITTPNLVLALVIISTPVLVAVLLLINQSIRHKS
jgi:hypothetical protein